MHTQAKVNTANRVFIQSQFQIARGPERDMVPMSTYISTVDINTYHPQVVFSCKKV